MIHETFAVDEAADVDVSVPSGSVVIEAGHASNIDVQVDARREDEWHVVQAGTSIRVYHERGSWLGGGRADIRLRLPTGTDLRVGSASADVRSTVDLGRVSVSSASGGVSLTSVRELTATTASGDIRVDDVAGNLSIKSASGEVTAAAVGGDVSVKTASGDTRIRTVAGALSVSSASGDIRVDAYRGADLDLTTMSGDIMFGLPSGTAVRLQASTLSGRVELPERRSSDQTGGEPVSARAKSVSGDIRVVRRDG